MKKAIVLIILGLFFISASSTAKMNPYIAGVSGVLVSSILLHSDGFESGDFTGWDGGEVDTGGLLSVQDTVKQAGTYAELYTMTASTAAYAKETLDSNVSEAYWDYYIYWSDVTDVGAANKNAIIGELMELDGGECAQIMSYTSAADTNLTRCRITYRTDAGAWSYSSTTAFAWQVTTWHHVRLYYKQSTGANDGILTLYIDNMVTPVITMTTCDNDERDGVGQVRCGISAAHGLDTDNGTLVYFDSSSIYEGSP